MLSFVYWFIYQTNIVIIDDNINNDLIRSVTERVTILLDYFKVNARDK